MTTKDPRDMTPEELRAELERLYKAAMKQVHPDKVAPEHREQATRIAAWLNVRMDEVNGKR